MKFFLCFILSTFNAYSDALDKIEKSQDPAAITIKQNSKKFSFCYANFILKKNLPAKGKITLNFKIDDKSNLLGLNVVQSQTTFKGKPFQDCMIKAMNNIHFPPAEVGKKIEVTHPFTFTAN